MAFRGEGGPERQFLERVVALLSQHSYTHNSSLLIAQFIKQRLSPHHSYRQLPSVTFWWLRLGVLATIAVFTNHEWAAWLYAVQSRDEWADLMFNEPSSSAQKVGMSLSSL
jgi:hypothetical protein